MSAIINQPSNKNFLSPLGFKFAIKRTPGVNYFVQSVIVPGMSLGSVDIPTPFVKLPFPGEHLDFADLVITFRVDEDLKNYREISDWMIALGKPKSFDQYTPLTNASQTSGSGVVSDATLTILSSAMNPVAEVYFSDVFPYDLTSLNFDSRNTSIEYIDVVASFKYTSYNITYLN